MGRAGVLKRKNGSLKYLPAKTYGEHIVFQCKTFVFGIIRYSEFISQIQGEHLQIQPRLRSERPNWPRGCPCL